MLLGEVGKLREERRNLQLLVISLPFLSRSVTELIETQ